MTTTVPVSAAIVYRRSDRSGLPPTNFMPSGWLRDARP